MSAPLADPDLLDRVRRRLVHDVPELVGAGRLLDTSALAATREAIAGEVHGVGVLQPLLERPGVTDVLVNAPDQVWTDSERGLERAAVRFDDDAAVRRLAVRLAVTAGVRLDDAAPWVDAALPGGIRLHAVLPPLVAATTLSLRVLRPPGRVLPALDPQVLALLDDALVRGSGVLVVGPTGAGKTTLLAALLGRVPPTERIVLVEDTAELAVDHPHVVRLQTRASNVEGAGGVGLEVLVRQALRMRPDRLVVGEFRGAETAVLLGALTTGHRGAATLHAPGLAGVPARLLALGATAGLDAVTVSRLAAVAFDVVVALDRVAGLRVVTEVGALVAEAGGLTVRRTWSRPGGSR
ncbi:ATPase, T2SS/T4P/T4SS family [Jatrophihabitans sp. YIM 134969]